MTTRQVTTASLCVGDRVKFDALWRMVTHIVEYPNNRVLYFDNSVSCGVVARDSLIEKEDS